MYAENTAPGNVYGDCYHQPTVWQKQMFQSQRSGGEIEKYLKILELQLDQFVAHQFGPPVIRQIVTLKAENQF